MGIAQLGYVGLDARDVGAWTGFLRDGFGMSHDIVDEGGLEVVTAIIDDYSYRLAIYDSDRDGLRHVGWLVDSSSEFERLADAVVAAGLDITTGTENELRSRGAVAMFWFADTAGYRVEITLGLTRTPARELEFAPGGMRGLGHLVLGVPDVKDARALYEDVLGFRLTDYRDPALYFLRCNRSHHSLALVRSDSPAMHHLEIEATSLDDVGQRYDVVRDAGIPIAAELGRHSNDRAFSFYVTTPGGFQMEYGWGGIDIDDETWTPHDFRIGDLWGHRRLVNDPISSNR